MRAGYERAQTTDEQEVLLHRRLTLDGRESLGRLEHRRTRGPARIVSGERRPVGAKGLHLRHRVE